MCINHNSKNYEKQQLQQLDALKKLKPMYTKVSSYEKQVAHKIIIPTREHLTDNGAKKTTLNPNIDSLLLSSRSSDQ